MDKPRNQINGEPLYAIFFLAFLTFMLWDIWRPTVSQDDITRMLSGRDTALTVLATAIKEIQAKEAITKEDEEKKNGTLKSSH